MMSRAVTAGHIMYDECIDAFRPNLGIHAPPIYKPSKSILLAAFEINEKWDLGICTIYPSTYVHLAGGRAAFVSTIENPNWIGPHNPQLFGIALSAIISFATKKVFKSTGDDYFYDQPLLSELYLKQAALFNPTITAGVGTQVPLTTERKILIQREIKYIIDLLHKIDYKKYRMVMQSMRMMHLALINKKEDFGLAYSLIVAAIEAIAQIAIKRDKVKQKHPSEEAWRNKAKADPAFTELLKAYKDANGKNSYLKQRYIQFILNYAPIDNWEEYVPHPQQEQEEHLKNIIPGYRNRPFTQKHWSEINPTQLDPDLIKEILSDSYSYRSSFIHTGEQPPHKDPNPSLNRFFEEKLSYDGNTITRNILPNFELMYGIAKNGLLNWLNEDMKK